MSEHSQQIPYYFWLEEEAPKTKLKLPKKVVSNRKGPLFLRSESSEKKEKCSMIPHTALTLHHAHAHAHKCNSLNRVPLLLPERPMELVERELGTMSCAQLKHSIENWLPESDIKCIRLPKLPLPLEDTTLPAVQEPPQHAPLPPQTSQQAPVQQDGNDPPMNVTITYNTHSQHPQELPRMSPQQLDHQPPMSWSKRLTTPLQDHTHRLEAKATPATFPLARLPHPSLGVQSLPALLTQHSTHTPAVSRSRRKGRSYHTHRLRPLLNHTTEAPSRRLSIAQQARLNSSRAPRRCTLQPIKAKTTH